MKVLCILTILGASISLFSMAFNFSVTVDISVLQMLQLASILIAIGKMTGGILMLQRRLTGLYIYTFAAAASVALTIAMACGLNTITVDKSIPMYEVIITLSYAIAILISVAFLVMYWLKVNRKLLS